MTEQCENCATKSWDDKHKSYLCPQWLGEAVGWQWWFMKDETWKDCHINYMRKKEEC